MSEDTEPEKYDKENMACLFTQDDWNVWERIASRERKTKVYTEKPRKYPIIDRIYIHTEEYYYKRSQKDAKIEYLEPLMPDTRRRKIDYTGIKCRECNTDTTRINWNNRPVWHFRKVCYTSEGEKKVSYICDKCYVTALKNLKSTTIKPQSTVIDVIEQYGVFNPFVYFWRTVGGFYSTRTPYYKRRGYNNYNGIVNGNKDGRFGKLDYAGVTCRECGSSETGKRWDGRPSWRSKQIKQINENEQEVTYICERCYLNNLYSKRQ